MQKIAEEKLLVAQLLQAARYKLLMKMKVLMLGWEFPPLINGGLGIACLGLGRALSKHVDLSFILPQVDPSYTVKDVKLIGLNHLGERDLERMVKTEELRSFAEVDLIQADLQPYIDAEWEARERIATSGESISKYDRWSEETGLAMFRQKSALYGEDVNARVIAFARAAAALAEGKEFDLIHAHDWMTFLAGMEIKARTGRALVLHVHSLSYDRAGPEARGWVYEIERQAMAAADLIIPVSHYTGKICSDHYGITPEKIHAVHNGADPVKSFHSKKSFPEKVVLFLGRITGQKGPRYFLEIAAKVLENRRDVRFVMAGTGERLRELIEYSAFRDVGDRLHFTGFLNREKVNQLLSMADVYCMPSVSEPFGLSALEAIQFDIPAVISKQSGVAEVLPQARQADFWDVDLMAQHILDLLNDEGAHAEAVRASREDQEHCTWERAAERVVALYGSELGLSAS